ncbi:surfeit locus protein 6-domain-containing protein [Bisporella sp. PMI_857]|nr:surfeit locus protein 6-domain-containing protein [Bisporella sp. PMI_857]
MAESSLQERLRDHAEAFDGLLSLIPAKHYYAQEDTSDQWKKKKQTKEQAAAARKAKLDPDSAKSAKDVMDERNKKRKLEEMEESDVEGVEKELPGQGLKKAQDKKAKKPKTTQTTESSQLPIQSEDLEVQEDEKRREKVERKQQKLAVKKEKKKAKQSKVTDQVVIPPSGDETIDAPIESAKGSTEGTQLVEGEDGPDSEIEALDVEGLDEPAITKDTIASPPSAPLSPTFDIAEEPSTNTSTTSIIPASAAPKHIKLSTIDPEILRSRLAARIEELRKARKADGPNGAPAKNRQELMEARRKKEEQRKAHKKELRLKAKLEEEARREAALSSARNSPASMLSPSIRSPDQNFSFGRVTFGDGQQLSDNLSTLLPGPKKRGPQDPATALQASEKRRLRIAGFDDEKRADIEEKDLWLAAKKRAHGEKVRDDSSLLKKTLKRKEKAKKKSENEWKERKEGIAKSQAMKQKKREENLKKRRDEKGTKGKKGGKGGAVHKSKKPKVKSRPGFEGSFGKRK